MGKRYNRFHAPRPGTVLTVNRALQPLVIDPRTVAS